MGGNEKEKGGNARSRGSEGEFKLGQLSKGMNSTQREVMKRARGGGVGGNECQG